MENYGKAVEYTEDALNSAGTAEEKFGAYTEGIEAKINSMNASLEGWATNLIDSGLVKGIIDATTGLIKFADTFKIVQILFIGLMAIGIPKLFLALNKGLIKASVSAGNFVSAQTQVNLAIADYGFNLAAIDALIKDGIINFGLMSQSQLMTTLTSTGLINAFRGLTKEEIINQLATMGVSKELQESTAQKILNRLATDGQTISIKALTQATWLHIKAMLKEIATMVVAHWKIMLIVGAIALLTAGLIYASQAEERLAKKVEETSQAHEEAKSKVEEATSALEENEKRIKELESQGSLTYVEQEELKNLKSATAELKLQLEYYKQIAKEKAEESIEAKEEKLEKHTKQGAFGTPILEAKNIADRISKVKKQEKDLEEAYQHLEDLRSGKIEETEASNGIMGGISEDTVESTKTNISLIKTSLETLTKDSKKMLEEYQSLIKDYELLPAEELTPDKKQRLEELRQEYQQLYLGLYPEQYKKIKWDEVLGLEEFKGAKEAIQKVVDANGDNADVVEMLKRAYPDLITKLKEFGIEEEEIIHQFKKQETATTDVTEALEDLKEKLQSVKDAYEVLNSAVDEYNSNGSISYDTWEKLINLEDQYLSALVDENGQIKANNEALQDLMKTQIEEITLRRMEQYVDNLLAAAQQGNLDAILLSTEGLDANTNARLRNIMAVIASNPALMQNREQILKTLSAMAQLTSSISLGSDSTKDAKDATEDWEKVLDYANTILDEQIEKLEKEQEALEKLTEEKIKAHEAEIKRLEKEKEALEEKNEEKNKELELEELQRNLQKAKQRTMRVYREGQGWVYEQDPEAVKEAQKELDDFYTEQQIENIEDLIEKEEEKIEDLEENSKKEKNSIEDRIKAIEKYKNEWNNVEPDYKKAQDKIAFQAQLGADAEKKILIGAEGNGGRLKVLNDFKTGYTKALGEVEKATEESATRINTALGSFNFEELKKMLNEINLAGKTQKEFTYDARNRGTVIETGASGEKFMKIGTNQWVRMSDVSHLGGSGYQIKSGTQMYVTPYASGTLSASSGLANVDEKGNELIVPKQGRYRMMEYGDTVVPHNLSQRLFDVASNPLRFIANALNSVKTPNLMSNSTQTSSSSVFHIGTIELPSVTNGESFIKQLQLIAANR